MLPEPVDRSPVGAIHGRLQSFHDGHYRYLAVALQLAEIDYVGITNPEAPHGSRSEATDAHRHLPESDPFTFVERERMVHLSVERACPDVVARLVVAPFDVNDDPLRWPDAFPLRAIQYVVPHEPWDHEKAARSAWAGYQVQLLASQQRRVTATQVRGLFARGDSAWEALVPVGTAEVLIEATVRARIQRAAPPQTLEEGDR